MKHALLAHGIFAHENDLTRIAGSSTELGTDERQLARAARLHGCELPVVRRGSAAGARHELVTHLAHGTPVLLCVDNWDHWITAVAMHGEDVVVFDSHYDMPLRVEPWDALADRLGFRMRRLRGMWTTTLYDLMPLVRCGGSHRLDLTPERLEHLLRPESAVLAQRVDEHAAGMLELATVPGTQLEFAFPLGDFLAARRESIIGEALRHSGLAAYAAAERLLSDCIFVAELYRLWLRPDREHEAVEHVAGIVARNLRAAPAAEAVRELVA